MNPDWKKEPMNDNSKIAVLEARSEMHEHQIDGLTKIFEGVAKNQELLGLAVQKVTLLYESVVKETTQHKVELEARKDDIQNMSTRVSAIERLTDKFSGGWATITVAAVVVSSVAGLLIGIATLFKK